MCLTIPSILPPIILGSITFLSTLGDCATLEKWNLVTCLPYLRDIRAPIIVVVVVASITYTVAIMYSNSAPVVWKRIQGSSSPSKGEGMGVVSRLDEKLPFGIASNSRLLFPMSVASATIKKREREKCVETNANENKKRERKRGRDERGTRRVGGKRSVFPPPRSGREFSSGVQHSDSLFHRSAHLLNCQLPNATAH